ncbi:MAG: RNase adapter RapZ [Desulfobacterales bacterium]
MKNLKFTIITGLSGSGKSTAIASFEDAGYYCVDNMPVDLLPKFMELPIESNTEFTGIAFVMDIREKGFVSKYNSIFQLLRKNGYRFNVLFLEADPDILINRYSQTRRNHPLAQGKNLPEAIAYEIELLDDLRNEADTVINTSRYTVHDLKSVIFDLAQKRLLRSMMQINIISFGYKNGVPLNADLTMDVRFLVNPYFEPSLKELTGESPDIQEFILRNEETQQFLIKFLDLLDYLIPLYEKEGKSYFTIGIGCTGGQHRSVTIAFRIAEHLREKGKSVNLTNRDI